MGLWVALGRFMTHDHSADFQIHKAQTDELANALSERRDLRVIVTDSQDEWPFPVIGLYPVDNRWNVSDVAQALVDGDPSIHLDPLPDRIQINTHCLEDDQIDPIIRRLTEELDTLTRIDRLCFVVHHLCYTVSTSPDCGARE